MIFGAFIRAVNCERLFRSLSSPFAFGSVCRSSAISGSRSAAKKNKNRRIFPEPFSKLKSPDQVRPG